MTDTGSEKKKAGIQINLTLNDLVGFGIRMVKSGLSLTHSLEEMIDHKLDEMVKNGKCTRAEATQAATKLKTQFQSSVRKFSGRIGEGVRSTLNRVNIATMDDMRTIEERLDTLIQEVEKLASEPATETGPKEKPVRKRPVSKKRSSDKKSGSRTGTPKTSQ